MKNFVIAIFAILIFMLGLLATACEFMSLIDREGVEKEIHLTFIITAVVSFPLSRFLWKLSKQK